MIDSFSFIVFFFLSGFLVFIVWIGVKFFQSLFTVRQSNSTYNEENNKHLREDSREDSQGDGLMLFDDPLFPEESDDEEDY
jgi:hypothetical protein